MKRTKKCTTGCDLLTVPHSTQEQLYAELNRLGFYWNSKVQRWERNDQLADPPSQLLRVRVWAAAEKVEQMAEIAIESMQQYGLKLLERSEPYPCRPPKQADSRIYLTFIEDEKE